jgi:hypothetical protein
LAPHRRAHRHDAHLVAVFLAEQRHGAFGDGVVDVIRRVVTGAVLDG